ncbi:MAG TPA: DUF3105 domain-containing protein [Gryllotalpicola sp.]
MRLRSPVLAVLALSSAMLLIGCTSSTSPGAEKSDSGKSSSEDPGAPSATAPAAEIVPAGPLASAPATTQHPLTTVPDDSGIPGVIAWSTTVDANGEGVSGAEEHTHVTGAVTYATAPPAGGPHDPVWMNAGVYDKPVPSERAVHNLEHGAIWITYRPSLPAAQVQQLVDFVGKQSLIAEQIQGLSGQSNRYLDLTPWTDDSLPSPIVVSAWGHQLRLTDPGDARLQRFVDAFRHSAKYTPELGAPVDGVPVQTGGVAARYGGTVPNPAGRVDETAGN